MMAQDLSPAARAFAESDAGAAARRDAGRDDNPLRKGRTPMKETEADRKVADVLFQGTADELRQFIEQWESLEAERKEIASQQKDVMSEAKARGYDTKIIRRVIALRKRDANVVAEEEAIFDLYRSALGMA